ncbi:MAG TPA: enolase C-terminal domain-like protein, partial [Solirubrobacteraceae bacterium]|nr:enolase C-terminal domain-like protein [Solirubrobacteraceae bacterium]
LALEAAGVGAVKVRIAREQIAAGIATVAAIRDSGAALQIMVDLNQWWRMPGDVVPGLDAQGARRVIEELADLGVTWVEEPLAGDDLAGMRMLREVTGVRIAGGEMVRSFDELRRALEFDALDVVQPDVVLALGIGATRTLAELALRRNRWFTPHTWTNGIGMLANLHVCCGVGGGPYLEYPFDPPGWTPERRDFMLATPLTPDADGCLAVPDAPGLGIELDEDAVAHYALKAAA